MKRLLALLALVFPLVAFAQSPILRNSITTNTLGNDLLWVPIFKELLVNGNATGGSIVVSSNSGGGVVLNAAGNGIFAGSLFLTGQTNQLSMNSSNLLFNGHAVLTNAASSGITNSGVGTNNYLAKWTGTNSLGNSGVSDNGSGTYTLNSGTNEQTIIAGTNTLGFPQRIHIGNGTAYSPSSDTMEIIIEGPPGEDDAGVSGNVIIVGGENNLGIATTASGGEASLIGGNGFIQGGNVGLHAGSGITNGNGGSIYITPGNGIVAGDINFNRPNFSAAASISGTTGDFTINTLTADTLTKANFGKVLTSIANAVGILTNDGSGGLGFSTNIAQSVTYNNITTTNLTVINALTVSNIITTNITVQNNLTTSNFFTVNGNHNTVIVTNALTLQTIKTNVLGTTSTGLLTNINYGSGLTWTPSTLTLAATAGGGVSTNASQYSVTGGAASGAANWILLTNAYLTAKSATPNGAALAANNRYTIFLLPGVYDATAQQLVLDTRFIDLVGLSPNTGDVLPTTAVTSQGDTVITSSTTPISLNNATSHDITLANLCLKTTTSGSESCIGTSQTGFGPEFRAVNILFCMAGSGNRPTPWDKNYNGTWIDCRAYAASGSTASRAWGFSSGSAVAISGLFIRCSAIAQAWGGDTAGVSHTLSGTFIDCWGGSASFGGSGATLSGLFIRCQQTGLIGVSAGNFLGGTAGTFSGRAIDCIADPGGNPAFGAAISGTLERCSFYAATGASITGNLIGCNIPGWNGPYPNTTSDSTQISNTASETNFSLTRTINAGDWKTGRVFKWQAYGKYSSTNITPGTITLKFKFGTTAIFTSDALTMPAAGGANLGWRAEGQFQCVTIGATGTIKSQGHVEMDTGTLGVLNESLKPSNGTVTVANNAAITAQMSVTFSAASASNAITLEAPGIVLEGLPVN